MTRKHFEAMAKGLSLCKPDKNGDDFGVALRQWEMSVCQMASVCAQFNRNFNRSRFYVACGFEDK